MIFARIGHGPCYYHWNEIFAGVQHQDETKKIVPILLLYNEESQVQALLY